MLKEEPDLKTVEVLHRLRGKGYEGAKSAVYVLTRALRAVQPRLLVRFEGLAGEFSQHDFGEGFKRWEARRQGAQHGHLICARCSGVTPAQPGSAASAAPTSLRTCRAGKRISEASLKRRPRRLLPTRPVPPQ